MKVPRILLAALSSGSGKTTLTCGMLRLLANRQLHPASFKCGPDYIDPLFHRRILGVPGRNLDSFFCRRELLRSFLAREAQKGAGIALLEGVMGYYDGLGGVSFTASTYEVAAFTETPVVLIINARGMSRSLSPLLLGMSRYREDSRICGVIFNRMSGGIFPRIKALVEAECGLPVLGYLPEVPELTIESRHLGLITPDEVENLEMKIEKLAALMEQTIDIGRFLALAAEAPDIFPKEKEYPRLSRPLHLGLAEDEAFCFIYEENRELFQEMGAELLPFSPLRDRALPQGISGMIFPGGYPELYAASLAANESLRRQIRLAAAAGMPLLAECGGFLYMHDTFEDMEGNRYPGVGAVHGHAYFTGKLSRFGYVSLTAAKDQLLGPAGMTLPAHEFHYFDSTSPGEDFLAQKPLGERSWHCIHGTKRGIMGFPHLYFPACPEAAWHFLGQCEDYRRENV